MKNQGENRAEAFEVGSLFAVRWLEKGKLFEGGWEVIVGSSCFARLGVLKGQEDFGFINGQERRVGMAAGESMLGLVCSEGRVQGLAELLIGGIHGSYRLSGGKACVGCVVVVFVGSKLGCMIDVTWLGSGSAW